MQRKIQDQGERMNKQCPRCGGDCDRIETGHCNYGEVIDVQFNTRWQAEREMKTRLAQVIDDYAGKIPAASAIGVLHLLIADLTEQCRD